MPTLFGTADLTGTSRLEVVKLPHIRKQLRDAMVSALMPINEFNGRIFPARVYPLAKEEVPAVIIYTEVENLQIPTRQHQQPSIVARNVQIEVYVFARAENILDELDALSLKVEEAAFKDYTLGGIANNLILMDTNCIINSKTDTATGAIRMLFVASVMSREGQPNKSIHH